MDVKIIRAISEWQTFTLQTPYLDFDLEIKLKIKPNDPWPLLTTTKSARPGRCLSMSASASSIQWWTGTSRRKVSHCR